MECSPAASACAVFGVHLLRVEPFEALKDDEYFVSTARAAEREWRERRVFRRRVAVALCKCALQRKFFLLPDAVTGDEGQTDYVPYA